MILVDKEVDRIQILERPTLGVKMCANQKCDTSFVPTRHNQKYCTNECCKIVTNAKIMQQYYEKKDRQAGKKRVCTGCKVTTLSRYNEGTVCQSCILAERATGRMELLRLVGAA